MPPPITAIATSRRATPATLEGPAGLPAALARARLEAAEWFVARRGLGLMAVSLAGFLLCALAGLVAAWAPSSFALSWGAVLPLVFLALVGLPVSGSGFLAGVVLSLLAPRRARLGGWIGTAVAGLVAVVLLLAAVFWREMPGRMVSISFRGGMRALTWSGVAALLVAHLGYCLYLAGIARRFGADRLARGLVASFVGLALASVLTALAEAAYVFGQQRWAPRLGGHWKDDLFLCAVGALLALGVAWVGLLWNLRRHLPKEEAGDEAGEE